MTGQITGANNQNSGGEKQPPMSAGKRINVKGTLSYFVLPGIIPEIRNLARGKFGYLAYLIAMIFAMVRILPRTHPFTKTENIGRFSVRMIVATAADHIEFSRRNIDQIVIYFAILAGIVLMILQVISFLMFLFMGDAWAGPGVPGESDSLFTTLNPDNDIAFYMIREVFGLPDMFGTLAGGLTPLHLGLHQLFEFYNLAILFVAVFVFLYYIIVVVGETAQSGIPFGQRFSNVYAPLRLVIAIGLLVPLNYGFNGAQYIAFYAAKVGSSLATNGWIRFNQAIIDADEGDDLTPLGVRKEALVARPNTPDITGLVEAVSVIKTCQRAYLNQEDIEIVPYFVMPGEGGVGKIGVQVTGVAQYTDVVEYTRDTLQGKGHVSLYFGQINLIDSNHAGNSTPYCGEIKIPIQMTDQNLLDITGPASPEQIQEDYFSLVLALWNNPDLEAIGIRFANLHHVNEDACAVEAPGECPLDNRPLASYKQDIVNDMNLYAVTNHTAVFRALSDQVDYQIDDEVLLTGWGGAGIWYNRIAQVNGAFVTAIKNIPNLEKRPLVMEKTLQEKQDNDGAFDDCTAYEPNLAENKETTQENAEKDDYYARAMNSTYQYWRCDRSGTSLNFFWDSITAIFGLDGLFKIRQNTLTGVDVADDGSTTNILEKVHPLAQLSSVGKSLVESAVTNMGLAMSMSFTGGMLGVLSPQLGSGIQAASGMFVSIATIGLSIGFILYYILPFLPFMYFFFAVGGWVKGLFEAMVGTPLWALAHLRIDGEGLPGRSAMSGYLLVFEIFLRPILTIFGLIGGLAIFTGMASILNEVFDIVVANVTGSDIGLNTTDSVEGTGIETENTTFGRHLIDEFFFTVVYTIILYMMAIASFKMINLVPNNILRWIGQSVSTFNDSAEDPTAGLTQYAAYGGQRIGGQLAGGATQLSQGAGSLVGEGAREVGMFQRFGVGPTLANKTPPPGGQ